MKRPFGAIYIPISEVEVDDGDPDTVDGSTVSLKNRVTKHSEINEFNISFEVVEDIKLD
jgi:hypothetical protein